MIIIRKLTNTESERDTSKNNDNDIYQDNRDIEVHENGSEYDKDETDQNEVGDSAGDCMVEESIKTIHYENTGK